MDLAARLAWDVPEPHPLTVSSVLEMPTDLLTEHVNVSRTGVVRIAQFILDHVTIFVLVVMVQTRVIVSHALKTQAKISTETVSVIMAGVAITVRSTVVSVIRCVTSLLAV
jgi:hypothetical protein